MAFFQVAQTQAENASIDQASSQSRVIVDKRPYGSREEAIAAILQDERLPGALTYVVAAESSSEALEALRSQAESRIWQVQRRRQQEGARPEAERPSGVVQITEAANSRQIETEGLLQLLRESQQRLMELAGQVGYLQAQLAAAQEEIKLLTVDRGSQSVKAAGWWKRLWRRS